MNPKNQSNNLELSWGLKRSKPSFLSFSSVNSILNKVKKELKSKWKFDIAVILVGDYKIRKLNKTYRKKDYITDVLSFNIDENYGELYICWPKLLRQSKKFQLTEKQEFERLFVHGCLHLAGYDHELGIKQAKVMFALQDKIVGWGSSPDV